jgi:hypothetical protein
VLYSDSCLSLRCGCRGYLRIVLTFLERFDLSRETYAMNVEHFARLLGVEPRA